MGIIRSYFVHKIAPNMPSKICSLILKKAGLKNSEFIRNKTYIENIDALIVGNNTFINKYCRLHNGFDSKNKESYIIIGNNVTIGYGTTIITSTHEIGSTKYRADFRKIQYKPVKIGDGTWICANCVILPGARIGNGCVIAAGSVVIDDCVDNGLYGGNPAKLIKMLDT